MAQLYREPGVRLEDWISATNDWHIKLLRKLDDTFKLISIIAKSLKLDDYFISDSDSRDIDISHASKKELDALAEQMRLEQISLGLPNTFE
jgi:hypothetical protein